MVRSCTNKILANPKFIKKIEKTTKVFTDHWLIGWLGCLLPSSRFAPRRAVQRSNPSTSASSPGLAVAIDDPLHPSPPLNLSSPRVDLPHHPLLVAPALPHPQPAGRSPRSHLGIQEPKNRNQRQLRFEFIDTSFPAKVQEFPRRKSAWRRLGDQRRRARGD